MPYQDRHADEAELATSAAVPDPVEQTQKDPNGARSIQVVILIGLVVAITVAIFGSY